VDETAVSFDKLKRSLDTFIFGLDRAKVKTGVGGGPSFSIGGQAPVPEARAGARDQVIQNWQDIVDSITRGANSLDTVLGGLWNGMQAGFQQAFTSILSGAQTFGSGLLTVFRSIVANILASLASLVAAKVFQLFLRLISLAVPGGAVAGAAIGAGASAAGSLALQSIGANITAGTPTGAGSSQQQSARASGAPSVQNIWNINAIDARDAVMDILSPSGSLRRANEQIAFQGAY
jgi:hypothetical protein